MEVLQVAKSFDNQSMKCLQSKAGLKTEQII